MFNVPKMSQNIGRVSGGFPLPGPAAVWLNLGRQTSELYYGAGGRAGSDMVSTSSYPHVDNTAFFTSHYWSTGGYAALGVTSLEYDPSDQNHYPANWNQVSGSSGPATQWQIAGVRVDLYLMPAASPYDGTRTYYDLVGAPRVVPRYAHGFLACRWGWSDRAYITR
jgi:alpha-glucosidase (family GH31 glycosyl hydrolase)